MVMEMKKRLLSILLSLVLMLGLLPGIGLTAYAGTSLYTAFIPTETDTDNELHAKQVTFNGKQWYIINDDSQSATEGTVTLLAADTSFGLYMYAPEGEGCTVYKTSKVKAYLDTMVSEGGEFEDVADVIADTFLEDALVEVKLYLLSVAEVKKIPTNVRKMKPLEGDYANYWRLRTMGDEDSEYKSVECVKTFFPYDFYECNTDHATILRPALRLDLSSVIFNVDTKTFYAASPVTYRVVNGTWSDGSTADKIVNEIRFQKPQSVPTGMKALEGYANGAWDTAPEGERITKATVFTYTFKAKQNITASNVTVTVGETGKSVSATTDGDGVISYAVKSGDCISIDADTGVLTVDKTGKATVTVTASETDTYALATKDVFVTVINKAAQKITASNVTATYGETGKSVKATTDGDGVISYAVKAGDEEYIEVDASTGALTLKKAGTATVIVTASETGNYAEATRKVIVKVTDKAAQKITASNVTATYGDRGRRVSATTDGDGVISYVVKAGGDCVEVDAATGALTLRKAGTATVTVTASETKTCAEATRDVTVTVNKADAVAATVTANNRTYDGTEKSLVTVSGKATGGTMRYALGTTTEATEEYTTSIPTAINAGSYYVWYKLDGDDNHNSTEPVNVEVTISPEVKNIADCQITAKDRVYTGEAITPKVTVKYNDKTLKVGTDYTLSYSKKLKAIGTATVTVKGMGSFTGFQKVSFRINPEGTGLGFIGVMSSQGKMALKWKERQNITGYQIEYSMKVDFQDALRLNVRKTKNNVTIRNLEGDTTYYVRIRTFRKVGKKVYFSAWSSTKVAKTKARAAKNEAENQIIDTTMNADVTLDLEFPDITDEIPPMDDLEHPEEMEIELAE